MNFNIETLLINYKTKNDLNIIIYICSIILCYRIYETINHI